MTPMVRADLGKDATTVARMFDEVAGGYDRTRAWLWLRRMNIWGRRTAIFADARPDRRILDVAAGTATSTAILAATGARAVACDFSRGMLTVGRNRHPQLDFVAGDALALPFATNTFDAVTISFGLRNVASPRRALAEMLRVTRPGGRLAVCEFAMPTTRLPRVVFRWYLRHAVPVIARWVSTNAAAYRYLAESIQVWPPPDALADTIRAAGWDEVGWRGLDGGVVVVHHARATTQRKGHPPCSTPSTRSTGRH